MEAYAYVWGDKAQVVSDFDWSNDPADADKDEALWAELMDNERKVKGYRAAIAQEQAGKHPSALSSNAEAGQRIREGRVDAVG